MKSIWNSLVRQLIPNVGTIVVVLLILNFYRVSAEPSTPPLLQGLTSSTLSYQGNLTNAAGQSVNIPVNLTFRLYNSLTSSAALWTESQNGVSVANGLFNVELGAVTPIPEMVWGEENLYLGVQVGSDNEMSPREMVGKVPIAAQAATVPDGSISSIKLGLTQGTTCLPSDITINLPGNWSPVDVLSFPITLERDSKVMIWMDGLGIYRQTNGTPGPSEFTFYVDTVPHTGVQGQTHPAYINIKGQRILTIPAGNHTLTLKALSFFDGTMEVRGNGHWQTCINYLVVG